MNTENILKKDNLTAADFFKLGNLIAKNSAEKRVGVGFAPDLKSKVNAMALISGLCSNGSPVWNFGEIFESELSFLTPYSSLIAGIFIDSQKDRVQIFGEDGMPKQDLNLKADSLNGEPCPVYGKFFDMSALEIVYTKKLRETAADCINSSCIIKSPNKKIERIVNDIINPSGADMLFRLNGRGTDLSFSSEKAGRIELFSLKCVCAMSELRSGKDICIPFDAPHFYDLLAKKYDKKALRYSNKFLSDDEVSLKNSALSELWPRDALFTLLKVLSILKKDEGEFYHLLSQIPKFYEEKRKVNLAFPIDFSDKLKERGYEVRRDRGSGLFLDKNTACAHIIPLNKSECTLLTRCENTGDSGKIYSDIEKIAQENINHISM